MAREGYRNGRLTLIWLVESFFKAVNAIFSKLNCPSCSTIYQIVVGTCYEIWYLYC